MQGFTLHRIYYGETRGGWVQSLDNVGDNARVLDEAEVYERARVYGNAVVSGTATVNENAQVYGNAHVYGDTVVTWDAQVYGHAQVYGMARINAAAQVYGNAKVHDLASIENFSIVRGDAEVCDQASTWGNSVIEGNALVRGYSYVDDSRIYGHAHIYGRGHVGRRSVVCGNASVTGNILQCVHQNNIHIPADAYLFNEVIDSSTGYISFTLPWLKRYEELCIATYSYRTKRWRYSDIIDRGTKYMAMTDDEFISSLGTWEGDHMAEARAIVACAHAMEH